MSGKLLDTCYDVGIKATMFVKPNLIFARSLHLTVRMPAWGAISDHLEAEYDATVDKLLVTTESHQLHELRGRARMIKELLELAETSAQLLERLEPKR